MHFSETFHVVILDFPKKIGRVCKANGDFVGLQFACMMLVLSGQWSCLVFIYQ